MYVVYPSRFETYGAVKIYELSRVQALFGVGSKRSKVLSVEKLDDVIKVAESTAIIIPVRDEDPNVIEGVIRAVPIYSPIVLVSASSQKPLNMYGIEVDVAEAIYKDTGRPMIVVHQRDPVIAEVLKDCVPSIVDEDGLVRYGKGEGMLIALLLADGIGVKNVGFIDADNYIPGAVLEYTLIYYTFLSLGGSKYKMVRVFWGYKAYGTAEFYLRKTGKVSAIVNNIMNRALSYRRRVETDIIKTSNSGEHAMTMDLARVLTYSGSYGIETQEVVSILEMCYIGLSEGLCPTLPYSIELYQVESRNPHIHAEKGESHIAEMLFESLATLYYSRLADERLKNDISSMLRELGYEVEPPPPLRYRYPNINTKTFLNKVLSESSYSVAYGL